MSLQTRVDALTRIPIFGGLSAHSLAHLAKSCRWHDYAAGAQIVGHQDAFSDVLFLLSGKARVIIYSAEGRAVVFADLVPATMFGEIAAIDGKPRSASVEAIEPCTVASLSAEQFEQVLTREPSVALATLRHVTAEVRRLSERVFEFSTMVVQNRVRAELVRLAREAPPSEGEVLLAPAPSLSDIANRISTHREAVSRELSRLTSLGILRREQGGLRITDIGALERLVDHAKGE